MTIPARIDDLADRYRAFADREAYGLSSSYERFARSVADEGSLLGRLLDLPDGKQQPNLLFAATRASVGLPDPDIGFARHALDQWDRIVPIILSRSTQTNEPGRCACLLPLLAQLGEDLALLEVGAAAGLCLLPDRYGYDYERIVLPPPDKAAPTFSCTASADAPLPHQHPQIVWRGGLDLNPLDVRDEGDMDWLRTLVWPEQTRRRETLDAAITMAQREPPHVIRGDLIADTEALAWQAPTGSRLVIFHTAVLNYVPESTRVQFAELVQDLGADWISNEGRGVLSDLNGNHPDGGHSGSFVLTHNRKPVAWTGPHGQSLDWFED